MAFTAETIEAQEMRDEHRSGDHCDADVIGCPICDSERAALALGRAFGRNPFATDDER